MSSSADRPTSRSSLRSQASISNPRLSTDKRRLSTDSTIRTPLPSFPGMSSLPGLSSNSPLASGRPPSPLASGRPPSPLMMKASIPPPTPPKDRLPPPMTPTRKPIQRQKSPLSTEAFSMASPASSMPGAFPTTPSQEPAGSQQSGYYSTTSGNPSSPQPQVQTPASHSPGKRASSFRNMLSFKALRRSYGDSSPSASPQGNGAGGAGRANSSMDMRPRTPSAESAFSSASNRPSLRHKMSGNFWRRKSSLGVLGFGANAGAGADEGATNGNENGIEDEARHGSSGNMSGTTYGDQANGSDEGNGMRSATPVPEDEDSIVPTKRRKSGTFWRRKSSLTLANALDGDATRRTGAQESVDPDQRQAINMGGSGKENKSPYATNGDVAGEEVPIMMVRTPSPPPQLPEFIGAGSGLGVEDLLKQIH